MQTGRVKFFKNDGKGYGFIEPDNGSKDVFVHASGVEEGTVLQPGDDVEFRTEVDTRSQKLKAVDVRVL